MTMTSAELTLFVFFAVVILLGIGILIAYPQVKKIFDKIPYEFDETILFEEKVVNIGQKSFFMMKQFSTKPQELKVILTQAELLVVSRKFWWEFLHFWEGYSFVCSSDSIQNIEIKGDIMKLTYRNGSKSTKSILFNFKGKTKLVELIEAMSSKLSVR